MFCPNAFAAHFGLIFLALNHCTGEAAQFVGSEHVGVEGWPPSTENSAALFLANASSFYNRYKNRLEVVTVIAATCQQKKKSGSFCSF